MPERATIERQARQAQRQAPSTQDGGSCARSCTNIPRASTRKSASGDSHRLVRRRARRREAQGPAGPSMKGQEDTDVPTPRASRRHRALKKKQRRGPRTSRYSDRPTRRPQRPRPTARAPPERPAHPRRALGHSALSPRPSPLA